MALLFLYFLLHFVGGWLAGEQRQVGGGIWEVGVVRIQRGGGIWIAVFWQACVAFEGWLKSFWPGQTFYHEYEHKIDDQ
jgi:hypothetical protein